MKNTLPTVRPGVRDNPIAGLGQVLHCRNLGTGQEQMPQQGLVSILTILNRREVTFRDYQHVDGGLGIDVLERQHTVILVNNFCWNGAFHDAAENTIIHSYPLRIPVEFQISRTWLRALDTRHSTSHRSNREPEGYEKTGRPSRK